MIEGAKKALAVSDAQTRIIPGHGPLATQQDLKDYIDMLETVYERLSKLKQDGKSVDEAVAAILDHTTFAELARNWQKSQTRYVANWDI